MQLFEAGPEQGPSCTHTTASWATVRISGDSLAFRCSSVGCTSTCATSSPTFAIATYVVAPGRVSPPGSVHSDAGAGDPIVWATPGLPASAVNTEIWDATTEPISAPTSTATRSWRTA